METAGVISPLYGPLWYCALTHALSVSTCITAPCSPPITHYLFLPTIGSLSLSLPRPKTTTLSSFPLSLPLFLLVLVVGVGV